MQHRLVSIHREPRQEGRVPKIHTGRPGISAPGGWALLGLSSRRSIPTHLPLVRLQCKPLFPPHSGRSLPPSPRWIPHTEIQAAYTHSPGCVSRGISTSQSPVQILYRKFPLSSKNSRPLCTTLLLKFWSPGPPAFTSSSLSSLGDPSLSVPLVPSQSLREYFCSSL